MKNKKLTHIVAIISTLILLSSVSVTSHAMSHQQNNKTMKKTSTYIHAVNSKAAKLSAISVIKRKSGYAVSGNVHLNLMQRRVLKIPGYISVELKSAEGKILETAQGRLHHKYGRSKAVHFDAVLKITPPAGSSIIVTHHSRFLNNIAIAI